MRAMLRKHVLTSVFGLSCLSVLAASCGGGGDGTTKFVGAWTFESGELTATCAIGAPPPFSLAGLPVTFARVDDSTISLTINTQCTVKFAVDGDHATAAANQMCTLDVGSLGPQNIAVTKWTLSLSGDRIDNDIAGMASICTAAGTAVLVRGTPDAGASDAASGG
jgi:hypothetical protein